MEYRKISDVELANILEQHKLWIKSKGKKGKLAELNVVDFGEFDLSGVDFSGAMIIEASFSCANLFGANFSGAELIGSSLVGADLNTTNLFHANLSGVDFSSADLSEANLSETNLYIADLSEANLYNANLSKANLIDAILINADFSYANLTGANLSKAELSGAILCDADLSLTNLCHSNFSNANITGARLWETQRAHWKIDGIICEYAYWDENGKERIYYKPGVFEKLYKEYPEIKLRYKIDEYTLTQHTLLPFIIAKLNEEYPSSEIVIKKTEEAPDGCSATVEIRGKVTESETEEIKNKTENYKNKAIQSEKKLLDQKVNLNLSKLLGINEQIVNDLGFGNIMINPTINIYSQDIYGNTQQITQSGNIQVTINQLREAIEKDLKESKNKNIHPESKSLFRKITGILKGAAEDEVKEQLRTLVKEYGKKAFEEIIRVVLLPETLNMLYQFIKF